jgi:hypothetical protein
MLILKQLGPRESPLVTGAHSRRHDGRFFRLDAARRFGLRRTGQRLDAGTFECLMVGVIFSEPGHSTKEIAYPWIASSELSFTATRGRDANAAGSPRGWI